MKISAYYNSKKVVLNFTIFAITLLLGSSITALVYKYTHQILLTCILAALTIFLSFLFKYLHKSSYYRMSSEDHKFVDDCLNNEL